MRKIIFKLCIWAGVLSVLLIPQQVRAVETAVFHVQTADVQDDGTITVTVYMTDTTELGGVDAELVYDPSKVTYVDSKIGQGFTDGISDINHLPDKATVKCLVIYPDTKTAHGELMQVTFQLADTESYQPELRIIDLVDGSLDIQPIPYMITYQQADGSWTDTQDISGIAADKSVIAEAKRLYSAGETAGKNTDENVMSDIEEGVSQEKSEEQTDEKQAQEGKTEEKLTGEGKQKAEQKKEAETAGQQKESNKETEERENAVPFAVIAGAVILIAVIICVIYRRKRKENEK